MAGIAYVCFKMEEPITSFGSLNSHFQFLLTQTMFLWTPPVGNLFCISVLCRYLCINIELGVYKVKKPWQNYMKKTTEKFEIQLIKTWILKIFFKDWLQHSKNDAKICQCTFLPFDWMSEKPIEYIDQNLGNGNFPHTKHLLPSH